MGNWYIYIRHSFLQENIENDMDHLVLNSSSSLLPFFVEYSGKWLQLMVVHITVVGKAHVLAQHGTFIICNL